MKKIITRLVVLSALIFGILLTIVLNPTLMFSNSTTIENYTIYHNTSLQPEWNNLINSVNENLRTNELFDPSFQIDICLNDGSIYPLILEKTGGSAFARGFKNKVVIMSEIDFGNKSAKLNGYNWNLEELIIHEIIHCLQYNNRGIFNSKPIAAIDNWKWECYAEFAARGKVGENELKNKINQFVQFQGSKNEGWYQINGDQGVVSDYYKYYLMVSYFSTVKNLNFDAIINLKNIEKNAWKEVVLWSSEK